MKEWLTKKQAADLAQVSPATIVNWAKQGRIVVTKPSPNVYRVSAASINALLANHIAK